MIRRGDVYVANLIGEGSVERGEHFVIVIQNDKGNAYSPVLTVIPISTSSRYIPILHVKINEEKIHGVAMIEQITTISKTQIISKRKGIINEETLNEICIKLINNLEAWKLIT